MSNLTTGIAGAFAALAVDQGTKAIVNANSAVLVGGVQVFPGFNLVYLRNDGVTFGLLGGVPWSLLSALALGIVGWLALLMVRAGSRLEALAYGLVIGGALGNVADRLRFGAVTDFLDFYVGGWHWPAFNLSDVAVVGGVGLLLLSELLPSRKLRRPKI
ncbi:signal peptidase II [Alterinioella nitratireducens]|uniref:signal peptidase II n=1 Tax=Alterinioella nitratireducens TaxID=2735915 RepID=UPI001F392DA6|nr:signal peptidase II [Alterinioella nitratireducens]